MKRHSLVGLASSVLITVSLTNHVLAKTIWLHEGKNDPATEGWTYNPLLEDDAIAGPVGPVGPGEAETASEDAWKIVDPGSDTRPTYESPRMTPSQVADFFAKGWEYTVRMSSPLESGAAHTRGFQFITPGDPADGTVYRVYITTNAALEQTVTVYNLNSVQRPPAPLSPGFHTYRLVGTPDAGGFDVSLFIDDDPTPAITDIPGFAKNIASILPILTPSEDVSFAQFGSFSGGGSSTLFVSHASFRIIPEPATWILAGVALFGLLGVRTLKRRSNAITC